MNGTLALSSFIASLDRDRLIGLIRARGVSSREASSPRDINDAIDLATELLKPDSISQALTQLTRDELRTLANVEHEQTGGAPTSSASGAIDTLFSLGILALGPAPLPEVDAALDSLLASHGLTRESLSEPGNSELGPSALGPSELEGGAAAQQANAPVDTSAWYAAALTTTSQIAWILRDITRTPAKLNRNGSIASVWVKSAEERLRVPRVDELIELMRTAGLTEARGATLVPATVPAATPTATPAASSWLDLEHEDRWVALVRAARGYMPAQVFSLLGGIEADASVASATQRVGTHFPLTTERTFQAIEAASSLWERLGVTVDGHFSAAGVAVLRTAAAADRQAERPSFGFPGHAAGVYIQPDLSVIVPGPLTAIDEARLASITLPEQLGVASTLRITEASLADALERGTSADAVREFLEHITLTGIPQPLEYLITSLHQRAGSVIVSPCDSEEGRTRIDFLRRELRSSVAVDRGLAHLQLHAGEHDDAPGALPEIAPLYSKLRHDHVLAALLDARYPAIEAGAAHATTEQPVGSSGDPHPAETAATTSNTDTGVSLATGEPTDDAAAIADRIIAAASDGPGEINRQVSLAVRDRSTIKVSLEMRGKAYDFTIVPVSLAAGRMRALDQAAGVERTIPVDAITSVTQLS